MGRNVTAFVVLTLCVAIGLQQCIASGHHGGSRFPELGSLESLWLYDRLTGSDGAAFASANRNNIPTTIPKSCPKNEVYTECKQTCPRTCAKSPPKDCPTICEPGCDCKRNHFRNNQGKCIFAPLCIFERIIDSPNPLNPINWFADQAEDAFRLETACGPNATYHNCANVCMSSCRFPNRYCPTIRAGNCEFGCRCKEGYVRDEPGRCVLIDDCH